MRLLIGGIFDLLSHNRVDYDHKWFQVSTREARLYKAMRIKNRKTSLPTYDKTRFDPKLHTWDEVAQAMCQAKLIHETIAVLSFLPIISSFWFRDFPVFLITSALSACYDLLFVFLQRSNRPRVLKILKKTGAQYDEYFN